MWTSNKILTRASIYRYILPVRTSKYQNIKEQTACRCKAPLNTLAAPLTAAETWGLKHFDVVTQSPIKHSMIIFYLKNFLECGRCATYHLFPYSPCETRPWSTSEPPTHSDTSNTFGAETQQTEAHDLPRHRSLLNTLRIERLKASENANNCYQWQTVTGNPWRITVVPFLVTIIFFVYFLSSWQLLSCFYMHHCVHRTPLLFPTLIQFNTIHNFVSYFSTPHFEIPVIYA
jgi:hypothetical protein